MDTLRGVFEQNDRTAPLIGAIWFRGLRQVAHQSIHALSESHAWPVAPSALAYSIPGTGTSALTVKFFQASPRLNGRCGVHASKRLREIRPSGTRVVSRFATPPKMRALVAHKAKRCQETSPGQPRSQAAPRPACKRARRQASASCWRLQSHTSVQAAQCSGRFSSNGGTPLLHCAVATTQRGWKTQPLGGLIGLGISPLMI